MAESFHFFRPQTIEQALAVLGRFTPQLLAGGTDFFPSRVDRPVCDHVLDLSGLRELSQISRVLVDGVESLHIGAMVTWSQVLGAQIFALPGLIALQQCAREVGGPQIQHRGTMVGNLCNASPAADGAPVLMALNARLELRSAHGTRLLPVGEFLLGPRRTALGSGEIVVGLLIPMPAPPARSVFLKMGSRRYLVISIAMLAAQWDLQASQCRIAVGACSSVAQRLGPLEAWFLSGATKSGRDEAIAQSLALLSPIDDVRADHYYRLSLVQTLCDKLALEVRHG